MARSRSSRAASRWISADANREAMRILRSNLLISLTDLANPVVIVTSARAGEGKTATCAGLAQSLSQANLRVVLVDMDLRHPDAHRWIGGHNEHGVVDVLRERHSLQQSLQFIDSGRRGTGNGGGLYFLAAGEVVPNPTELLGTTQTSLLFKSLAKQADIVLLDTAPVLPVADTLVIGRMAAGAILVVEAARTPINAVQEAKASLIRSQTRLLGLVLNQLGERSLRFRYAHGDSKGVRDARNDVAARS